LVENPVARIQRMGLNRDSVQTKASPQALKRRRWAPAGFDSFRITKPIKKAKQSKTYAQETDGYETGG
jgi:hypothetical protein